MILLLLFDTRDSIPFLEIQNYFNLKDQEIFDNAYENILKSEILIEEN
jgi:hypothetical protein